MHGTKNVFSKRKHDDMGEKKCMKKRKHKQQVFDSWKQQNFTLECVLLFTI